MRQEFFTLKLNTNGQKLYEFTEQTNNWISKFEFKNDLFDKYLIIFDSL